MIAFHYGHSDGSYHRPMAEWLNKAKAIDTAVYGAIAASETPSLDIAMSRLSRAADQSKLWFATAAALALLGGPSGRLAARKGLVSLGIASGFANLIAKPLSARRRPARRETEELASRHVQMPRSSSFPSGHSASAFAFASRRRRRAADALGAAAGPGDAGRVLPDPYWCPLSRRRARGGVYRGQRGGAGRPSAGSLSRYLGIKRGRGLTNRPYQSRDHPCEHLCWGGDVARSGESHGGRGPDS